MGNRKRGKGNRKWWTERGQRRTKNCEQGKEERETRNGKRGTEPKEQTVEIGSSERWEVWLLHITHMAFPVFTSSMLGFFCSSPLFVCLFCFVLFCFFVFFTYSFFSLFVKVCYVAWNSFSQWISVFRV